MEGLNQGKMLIPGATQAYSNKKAVNVNFRVGKGIYCTPHLNISLKQYTG